MIIVNAMRFYNCVLKTFIIIIIIIIIMVNWKNRCAFFMFGACYK